MIVWRGWGIVVFGIALLAFFLAGAAGQAIGARWVSASAGAFLIVGGVACWFLGKRLNANTTRELVDPKTGQTVTLRRDHSFFFLPVEWWGPIMVILGAVILVAGIASPPAA